MAYTLRSVSCLWLYLITSTQTKQVQVKTGQKFGYFQFGPWQFESIYRVNDFITKFIESNYQIIKSETQEDSILARTFKKLAAGSNIAATDAGRCFCFVLFSKCVHVLFSIDFALAQNTNTWEPKLKD